MLRLTHGRWRYELTAEARARSASGEYSRIDTRKGHTSLRARPPTEKPMSCVRVVRQALHGDTSGKTAYLCGHD